jgi:hypothetical protein
MDLAERAIFLIIGGGVGFILGYITARLREIKEGVDNVRDMEKEILDRDKGERGSMRVPRWSEIGLFAVLCLTVWAAFQAGATNANLDNTVTCVVEYNEDQGLALEGRDQANMDGTQSEIDLWNSYEKLYKIVTSDPSKTKQVQEELNADIIKHRDELLDIQKTREANPYPDPAFVTTCKESKS